MNFVINTKNKVLEFTLILTINNKSISDLTPILYVIFKAIEY